MDEKDKIPEQGKGPKEITVTINGRARTYEREQEIDFYAVVKLAYPDDELVDTTIYTVTYAGPRGVDGAMVEGDKVHVKDGMIFNVRRTDRS